MDDLIPICFPEENALIGNDIIPTGRLDVGAFVGIPLPFCLCLSEGSLWGSFAAVCYCSRKLCYFRLADRLGRLAKLLPQRLEDTKNFEVLTKIY